MSISQPLPSVDVKDQDYKTPQVTMTVDEQVSDTPELDVFIEPEYAEMD